MISDHQGINLQSQFINIWTTETAATNLLNKYNIWSNQIMATLRDYCATDSLVFLSRVVVCRVSCRVVIDLQSILDKFFDME